jgi:hypothetical protein
MNLHFSPLRYGIIYKKVGHFKCRMQIGKNRDEKFTLESILESPKRQLRALKKSSANNRKLNKHTYFYHGF